MTRTLLVGLALCTTPLGAQARWQHLGARQVNFRADHDVITAGLRGTFRSIRIDVDGGDLEMFNIKVTFGNGESFSPPTRYYFKPASKSRVINLPGDARIIRRIDFFYTSVPGGGQGRATVNVYARK